MKEITRIHIAKTPYECETAAKKDLHAYMQALEAYSGDREIIEDVEIRITEILSERGVKKGGVITEKDVAALKQQLGDPSEFMGDGDIAVGHEKEEDADGAITCKLYRDGDNAVIGGVLAGIAAFFKINPMWVRLVFILLALASFGTAILVYAVLWIAVPEAKTAADKLQMAGRPVTLRAIREVNANEAGRPIPASANGRRIGLSLLGILSVFGAAGAAAITVAALFGGIFVRHNAFTSAGGSFLLAAFVLALVSGVLLTALFTLAAYASFARKLDRRIIISTCVVIVLGLGSFGVAAGLAKYGSMRDIQVMRENTHEQTVALPQLVKSATAIKVQGEDVRVQYVVSPDVPSAKLRATVQRTADMPKVETKLENGVLNVSVKRSAAGCGATWGCDRPVLTIYGPALTKVMAGENSLTEYEAAQQQKLEVAAGREASVTVSSGSVDTLVVSAAQDTQVVASNATIKHMQVTLKSSATVEAGTVQSLIVTHDNACPSHAEANVSLEAIIEGKMTVNGIVQAARTTDLGCVGINIENGENE